MEASRQFVEKLITSWTTEVNNTKQVRRDRPVSIGKKYLPETYTCNHTLRNSWAKAEFATPYGTDHNPMVEECATRGLDWSTVDESLAK